jgi:hypothetical protein
VSLHAVCRVAYHPWGTTEDGELDNPGHDGFVLLHVARARRELRAFPEEQRDALFKEWIDGIRAGIQRWNTAFRQPAPPRWRDQVDELMAGPPTTEAQLAVAHFIAAALEPLRAANDLPPYAVCLTTRKTILGVCHLPPKDQYIPHEIHVRGTPPGAPERWLALDTMIYGPLP